jgi:hypothetical protein
MPLVMISTCDSSVNYAQLCVYETPEGNPPSVGHPAECDFFTMQFGPEGSCVLDPLQVDRDKWNLDRNAFNTTREKYEKEWPVAGGIISGGYRCWAGVKRAVMCEGEPEAEDTYGNLEFMRSGSATNARIDLADLQTMFTTLYNKHGFKDENGDPTNEGTFGFLFVVDATGSIVVSEWPASVKTDFEAWIDSEYPNCRKKVITLSNYLVDGEDWLRHFDKYYRETVRKGI